MTTVLRAIEFQVERPEDLLVWADLWEDEGLPRHGQVLRELHEANRWPQHLTEVGWFWMWSWWTTPAERKKRRASIDSDEWGIVGRNRHYYASLSLAFLELVLHRVEKEKKEAANGVGG